MASEGEVPAFQLFSVFIIEGLKGLQVLVVRILCEAIEVLEVNYLLSFLWQAKLGTVPGQVEGQT